MQQFVNVEGLGRLPEFSHAAIAGDTIYVSGTLGTAPGGLTLVEGGVGPETTQVLRNLETILAAYGKVFTDDPPARITVGVSALALGAAVEMDCVAHRVRS